VQRTFSLDDQLAFAALSGDANPMHVDAVAARRLMYGALVVHGMHLAAWAIEHCGTDPARVHSLKAKLNHVVRVGDAVGLDVKTLTGTAMQLTLTANDRAAAVIQVTLGDPIVPVTASAAPVRSGNPRAFSAADVATAAGDGPVMLDADRARSMFPIFAAAAPDLLAALAASSWLVGMECPGLHSIYSSLHLTRRPMAPPAARQPPVMTWRVKSFDDRFSRLALHAVVPGADLEMEAFLRPPPQPQPGYASLQHSLAGRSYAGRRALVVGGSRGLGELCAKLLAAGGADVCLTYRVGKAEAERIVEEIVAGQGRARLVEHDVLGAPAPALLALLQDWQPTHLYYFATPAIFVGTRRFSPALFRQFCEVYVNGLVNTLKLLGTTTPLQVFYPSTVAVEETLPELGEYAAAKAAGEVVCRQLAAANRLLTIQVARLPRLPTDQTATVFPTETADPVPLLISLL
jgi:NADP-dependent 3-hydroxy acid dehydrogenase YdfG